MAIINEVEITRHDGESAPAASALAAVARHEGYAFVDRFIDEWTDGTNRFSRDGEQLLIASVGDDMVAMCGMNLDPYVDDPTVGRVRRLYVHPSARRIGVARLLVRRLLDDASAHFDLVRLRTPGTSGAAAFYESLGFSAVDGDHATHQLPVATRRDDVRFAWRSTFTSSEVNELHAEAFETRVFSDTEWDWRAQVTAHSLGWVTARSGGELVGFVNVISDGFVHAWIQDAMVASSARSSGIGRTVIDTATDHARRAGCEWLHVDFDAELAPFYIDTCGFTPTSAGLIDLTDSATTDG